MPTPRSFAILFLTQESSAEIVQAALNLGAHGCVLKSDATELLFATGAVLRGEQFVSRDLKSKEKTLPSATRFSFVPTIRFL